MQSFLSNQTRQKSCFTCQKREALLKKKNGCEKCSIVKMRNAFFPQPIESVGKGWILPVGVRGNN